MTEMKCGERNGRFGAWSWTACDCGMSYQPSFTYATPDGDSYTMTVGYGDDWGNQVVGEFDDSDSPEDTAPLHDETLDSLAMAAVGLAAAVGLVQLDNLMLCVRALHAAIATERSAA